ncbi:unnamed protein product [Brachionus calyciflorus]|uniref:TIR domain-containing protein n=1 Tax=Brachionus calyciflorus TaxID=104777 RepID=A0A813M233_9BILA|nr:unnamed protein product [Brachionus calyciflorus]
MNSILGHSIALILNSALNYAISFIFYVLVQRFLEDADLKAIYDRSNKYVLFGAPLFSYLGLNILIMLIINNFFVPNGLVQMMFMSFIIAAFHLIFEAVYLEAEEKSIVQIMICFYQKMSFLLLTLALILNTVLDCIIGSFWYSDYAFGQVWLKFTYEDRKDLDRLDKNEDRENNIYAPITYKEILIMSLIIVIIHALLELPHVDFEKRSFNNLLINSGFHLAATMIPIIILRLFFYNSNLKEVELLNNLEDNRQKLEESFKYLKKLKNNLINDKTSLKIFLYLNKLSKSDKFNDILNDPALIENYKIYSFFSNVLKECALNSKEFINKNKCLNDSDNQSDKQSKIKIYFLFYSIEVIAYLTQKSNFFCIKFHEKNGTKYLLKYLTDDNFIRNCLNFKSEPKNELKVGANFIQTLVQCLKNLSKICDENKNDWDKLEATSHLIKFSQMVSEYPNILILSNLTITNIINEKELNSMSNEIILIIIKIIDFITVITDEMAKGNETRKLLEIKPGFKIKISIVKFKNLELNLIELLEAINHIAVNDKLKYKIYQEYDLKSRLKTVVLYGNDYEKHNATKLLWQLCFDHNVCKKMNEDKELVKCLEDINKTHDDFLKENIVGIFWLSKLLLFNDEPKKKQKKKLNLSTGDQDDFKRVYTPDLRNAISSEEKQEHIMISYNRENRDICLKIKEELERDGHKVWIDVQDIRGSSLESMAKAIENSKCVLICMTEKYKQSPNCRAEAEYSFNLRKPIIPLIMQPNYIPDGWLGIILGTKIYINFSKYNFEDCLRKLKTEIKTVLEPMNDLQKETGQNLTMTDSSKEKIEKWTNQDIKKWLKEKQIHPEIASTLYMFNGELLFQLHKTYKTSPEYFNLSISKNNQIDLYSVIHFTSEFEKLFK